MTYTVLILDSDDFRTQQMMDWLIPTRTYLICTNNVEDAFRQLRAQVVDVVFIAAELPGICLDRFINEVLLQMPMIQIVIMLSHEEFQCEAEVQQLQVRGFIVTPFRQDALLVHFYRLTEMLRLKRENQYLREEQHFEELLNHHDLTRKHSPRGKRWHIRIWY